MLKYLLQVCDQESLRNYVYVWLIYKRKCVLREKSSHPNYVLYHNEETQNATHLLTVYFIYLAAIYSLIVTDS